MMAISVLLELADDCSRAHAVLAKQGDSGGIAHAHAVVATHSGEHKSKNGPQ
jgi:hypothetical protein